MNWPDLSMGGYGFYIWGSYLFALLAFVWELVTLSYRKKNQLQEKAILRANTNDLRGSTNETTS
jgi:heme exporter protein D